MALIPYFYLLFATSRYFFLFLWFAWPFHMCAHAFLNYARMRFNDGPVCCRQVLLPRCAHMSTHSSYSSSSRSSNSGGGGCYFCLTDSRNQAANNHGAFQFSIDCRTIAWIMQRFFPALDDVAAAAAVYAAAAIATVAVVFSLMLKFWLFCFLALA